MQEPKTAHKVLNSHEPTITVYPLPKATIVDAAAAPPVADGADDCEALHSQCTSPTRVKTAERDGLG